MRFQFGDNYSDASTEIPPIQTFHDGTADNSAKSWVVPDNEMWQVVWAHVILVTTATVGDRELSLDVYDENSEFLIDCFPPVVQAASLTRHYVFQQGIFRETAFAADSIQVPIPHDLYLLPGYTLKIWDRNAVDAAADDIDVSFQVKRWIGAA